MKKLLIINIIFIFCFGVIQAQESRDLTARQININLINAIEEGNIKEVKKLLNKVKDINKYIYLKTAEDECLSERVSLFITPLGKSVENNNIKITRLLLDKGANIDKGFLAKAIDMPETASEIKTPLYIALSNKNKKIAKLLISKGANVNFIYEEIGGDCENESSSVLMKAVSWGNKDIIKLLVDKGAKVDEVVWQGDSQTTALQIAQEQGDQEIIKLLKNAKK